MKNIWQNPWFFIPILLFFNAGLALNYCIGYGDEILFFNAWRVEPLNTFFRGATYLGEAWPHVAAGVAALFWRYRFVLLIALNGLFALPIMYVLKDQFGVDRPNTYYDKLDLEASLVTVPGVRLNGGQTSFPSGHTMSAFSLCNLLALMAGPQRARWGLPLVVLAMLVGVSRIFLVQHFLSDVLAGAFLGLLLSSAVWRAGHSAFLQKQKWLDGRLHLGTLG
jgi:membrane-associated phospholipid phosphatase